MISFAKGFAVLFLFSNVAFGDFLPPNDLHLEDQLDIESDLSEEEFDAIIEKAYKVYAPIVKEQGGNLQIDGNWPSSTVNASASRRGSTWQVNMYGGLARRPEVTRDGFALVLCHELGHHLGGFPFSSRWAANEGQSDYFATLSCAREIWADDDEENAKFRRTIDAFPKGQCDSVWSSVKDQNLCYRSMEAGKSLADLLGGSRGQVAYDTPDKKTVTRTNSRHPEGQCRLDTYMAGAVCSASFDTGLIPKDEKTSADVTCTRMDSFELGTRPLCWYKPKYL